MRILGSVILLPPDSLINEMIHEPYFRFIYVEKNHSVIFYKVAGILSKILHRKAFESFTFAKELVESYNDVYLLKVNSRRKMRIM